MDTLGFESLILFVSDLRESRAFYVDGLGLPVVFEDDVIVVVGAPAGRVVLTATTWGTTRGASSPPAMHGHIDAMIETDPAIATATIWQRLADDHGTTVAYPTLRAYVAGRRAANSLGG